MGEDSTTNEAFDTGGERAMPGVQAHQLVLDLDGFEGPIDALLNLARDQKVDLVHISILELADQYLAFIEAARDLRLEIAADYLVMAAWLAYLKSRLLLPTAEDEEEPSGEAMAEALAYQLRRLQAMQDSGARLMARPRLGVDVFARGAPEGITVIHRPLYDLSLYELLKAYAGQQRQKTSGPLVVDIPELYAVEDALARLGRMLGDMATPDWRTLASFLPAAGADPLLNRSALAASFAAILEMTRDGALQLRQDAAFGPIYLRGRQ